MLPVKGNQPKLRAAIAARRLGEPPPAAAAHTHSERRDGQLNTWQTTFYAGLDPAVSADWAGVAGVVIVEKTVASSRGTRRQTRAYLTSLGQCPVAELAAGIRGHWGIENKLHRTRDVHFGQDTNGIRHPVAAANVAIFNTLALNYLLTNVGPAISDAQLFFAQNWKNFMP